MKYSSVFIVLFIYGNKLNNLDARRNDIHESLSGIDDSIAQYFKISSASAPVQGDQGRSEEILLHNIKQWEFVESQLMEPGLDLQMPEIMVPLKHLASNLEKLGYMYAMSGKYGDARTIMEKACPLLELLLIPLNPKLISEVGAPPNRGQGCFSLLSQVYSLGDFVIEEDISKIFQDLRAPFEHLHDGSAGMMIPVLTKEEVELMDMAFMEKMDGKMLSSPDGLCNAPSLKDVYQPMASTSDCQIPQPHELPYIYAPPSRRKQPGLDSKAEQCSTKKTKRTSQEVTVGIHVGYFMYGMLLLGIGVVIGTLQSPKSRRGRKVLMKIPKEQRQKLKSMSQVENEKEKKISKKEHLKVEEKKKTTEHKLALQSVTSESQKSATHVSRRNEKKQRRKTKALLKKPSPGRKVAEPNPETLKAKEMEEILARSHFEQMCAQEEKTILEEVRKLNQVRHQLKKCAPKLQKRSIEPVCLQPSSTYVTDSDSLSTDRPTVSEGITPKITNMDGEFAQSEDANSGERLVIEGDESSISDISLPEGINEKVEQGEDSFPREIHRVKNSFHSMDEIIGSIGVSVGAEDVQASHDSKAWAKAPGVKWNKEISHGHGFPGLDEIDVGYNSLFAHSFSDVLNTTVQPVCSTVKFDLVVHCQVMSPAIVRSIQVMSSFFEGCGSGPSVALVRNELDPFRWEVSLCVPNDIDQFNYKYAMEIANGSVIHEQITRTADVGSIVRKGLKKVTDVFSFDTGI